MHPCSSNIPLILHLVDSVCPTLPAIQISTCQAIHQKYGIPIPRHAFHVRLVELSLPEICDFHIVKPHPLIVPLNGISLHRKCKSFPLTEQSNPEFITTTLDWMTQVVFQRHSIYYMQFIPAVVCGEQSRVPLKFSTSMFRLL